jgi:glycosyltransferase involved in cell wall biosynthesis
MKILWIPHTSWDNNKSRDQYFIEEMKKKHEIHVLTWTQPNGPDISNFLNPKLYIDGFQPWDKEEDGVYLHHYQRFHNTSFTPNLLKINERKFQLRIREIVNDYNVDVIICAPSYYLNGFPPFDINIPIIFDYLDYIDDKNIRDIYLKKSNSVLCVSHDLLKYSLAYNKNSYYLPNTLDTSRLAKGNADRVRKKYGLDDSAILTLIGLSTSNSYYLIDTFPIVKKKIKDIKYLIVGKNHHYTKMKKKAKKYSDIIFTGWVNNIEDFFAVTDIGTYPVDKTIYDDCRCPIKILEYTVLGRPVVSANINEVIYWNFPNVFLSQPCTQEFAKNIIKAYGSDFEISDMSNFDINNLTEKLTSILEKTFNSKK